MVFKSRGETVDLLNGQNPLSTCYFEYICVPVHAAVDGFLTFEYKVALTLILKTQLKLLY